MKHWIVVVEQRDCVKPRTYRYLEEKELTVDEMIENGADIVVSRGDVVTTQEVSGPILNAWPGKWIMKLDKE
jgi:hypothetical protein